MKQGYIYTPTVTQKVSLYDIDLGPGGLIGLHFLSPESPRRWVKKRYMRYIFDPNGIPNRLITDSPTYWRFSLSVVGAKKGGY